MKVIRDEEMSGIMMIPLFNQWGIHRCNVRDCTEKQTTIIVELADRPFALCEKHYTECKDSGKIKCTLDFETLQSNAHKSVLDNLAKMELL